jgi:3-oxoacyl-[acyl-carrier protein] reductase
MVTIDLSGRKALVTGGARGIGAGIVHVLAECGAAVAFTHLSVEQDVQAAQALVSELADRGHSAFGFPAPAQDMAAMGCVVAEAADKMGGLDIVVPNVGATWVAPVDVLELEAWQKGLELNLTTAFIAVKLALPWLLKAGRGEVVLIGSSAAYDGGGGSVHYPAAKAGLVGLMYGLMREFPRRGIRVNAIHPCVVNTDLLRDRYDTEEKRAKLAAQVPVGRLARPEDIGYLVASLCSDLGSFICGQSLLVDGGRTLWRQG